MKYPQFFTVSVLIAGYSSVKMPGEYFPKNAPYAKGGGQYEN